SAGYAWTAGGFPEGANSAWIGDNTTASSQKLSEVITPNTNYTLSVDVGNRSGVAYPGYRIRLMAGSTVLAENSSLSLAAGQTGTAILTYVSPPSGNIVGQSLTVALLPGTLVTG